MRLEEGTCLNIAFAIAFDASLCCIFLLLCRVL